MKTRPKAPAIKRHLGRLARLYRRMVRGEADATLTRDTLHAIDYYAWMLGSVQERRAD